MLYFCGIFSRRRKKSEVKGAGREGGRKEGATSERASALSSIAAIHRRAGSRAPREAAYLTIIVVVPSPSWCDHSVVFVFRHSSRRSSVFAGEWRRTRRWTKAT